MTKNDLSKKPNNKIFKYVIGASFIILILVRLTSFYDNRTDIFKEHDVNLVKSNISLVGLKIKNKRGEAVKLDKFIGNVSLVVFWATWCKFCAKDFPYLAKLSKFINKNNLPINIIPIVDPLESYFSVKKFYRRFAINERDIEPYLSHGDYLHYVMKVRGYPSFLVLDKQLKVIARLRPNLKNTESVVDLLLGFKKEQKY